MAYNQDVLQMKGVIDQSTSSVLQKVDLLEARNQEYQRELQRHMDEERMWHGEFTKLRDEIANFKYQVLSSEADREREHRNMEERIVSNTTVKDKEERERRDRMVLETVENKINAMKTSLLQWIGFGGIVFVAGIVFYFGSLGEKVEYHSKVVNDFQVFMASGERFTRNDGVVMETRTITYIDQQNAAQDARINRIEDVVKEGFADIKKELREMSKN
jgi:hypothetical protein